MQLEFKFADDFFVSDLVYAEINAQARKFFEELFAKIQLKDVMGEWLRSEYRSGGVFLYRFPLGQLEFPHSDYWGCEDCEP